MKSKTTTAYSYEPSKIRERGKDQMRFELGDTLVGGGAETCALADEEYEALLAGKKSGKRAWQAVKLAALEAIMMKLSFEVDTRIGPLQYSLGQRAIQWRAMYESLKREVSAYAGVPSMGGGNQGAPPYFTTGMMENKG